MQKLNILIGATLALQMLQVGQITHAQATETRVFIGKPSKYEDFGYIVREAAWIFVGEKIIHVCWENPSEENEDARAWTEDQIKRTWERVSALSFIGWERCAKENDGIRIKYEDSGPHVKEFGRHINGVVDGMVLNHKFENWRPACPFDLETCIRTIATHEFGHALGFAHEQNRPDTPGECARKFGQDQPGEITITPYDKYSVMNYCNDKNNNGKLSELDIVAVQKIYGKANN